MVARGTRARPRARRGYRVGHPIREAPWAAGWPTSGSAAPTSTSSSGAGCWVTTADGTRYLDFTSGIAVTSTGPLPPAGRRGHPGAGRAASSTRRSTCYRHDLLAAARRPPRARSRPPASTRSSSPTPAPRPPRPRSSWPSRPRGDRTSSCSTGSFHGRTHLAMAMTTSKYVVPGRLRAAARPACSSRRSRRRRRRRRPAASPASTACCATQTAPAETAAVVIEPVLGEGGYRPAPAAFLHGLVERCRAHGILFVADEVQTGFGRTGTMFAVDRYRHRARRARDGQGHRLGLPALGRRRVGRAHGPLARRARTAAPTAATRSAARPRWPRSTSSPSPGSSTPSRRAASSCAPGWRRSPADDPGLVDVRGPGLMVGCDLVDPATGAPDAARAAAVLRHCQTEGHLLLMSVRHRGQHGALDAAARRRRRRGRVRARRVRRRARRDALERFERGHPAPGSAAVRVSRTQGPRSGRRCATRGRRSPRSRSATCRCRCRSR